MACIIQRLSNVLNATDLMHDALADLNITEIRRVKKANQQFDKETQGSLGETTSH